MNNCVYILQSLRTGSYYIGSTNDIKRRLLEHEKGKVTATKFLRPLELKLTVLCLTLTEARKAEYKLKQYKSKKILVKFIESGIFPWKYNK